MAKGYTLEQLKAMGAVPKAQVQGATPKRGLTLEELQARGAVPKGGAATPAAEAASAVTSKPLLERADEATTGLLRGALKGIGSTVTGASALGEKMLQAPLKAFGVQVQKPLGEEIRESGALTPQGTAEKVGFGAEQIAEFLVPVLPKGTGLLGKVAGEAIEAGGKTAMQRGKLDKEAAKSAAISGGFTAAGALLGMAGKSGEKALKSSAEKGMVKALAPTTKEMKLKAAKVAPGMVERGVTAMTRKGLAEKAAQSLDDAGAQLDKVLETIPEGSRVSTKPVLEALIRAKADYAVGDVVAEPKAVKAIDDMIDVVKKMGDDAPFESMRSLRQILDKTVAKSKGFLLDEVGQFSVMAKREASNAIRSELARQFPNLDKVNKEFSFWKNVDDVLQATLLRTESQAMPLGEKILGAAGAAGGMAHGGVGGAVTGALVMANLQKLVRSTGWRTVGSLMKKRIADALGSGNLQGAMEIIGRLSAGAAQKR